MESDNRSQCTMSFEMNKPVSDVSTGSEHIETAISDAVLEFFVPRESLEATYLQLKADLDEKSNFISDLYGKHLIHRDDLSSFLSCVASRVSSFRQGRGTMMDVEESSIFPILKKPRLNGVFTDGQHVDDCPDTDISKVTRVALEQIIFQLKRDLEGRISLVNELSNRSSELKPVDGKDNYSEVLIAKDMIIRKLLNRNEELEQLNLQLRNRNSLLESSMAKSTERISQATKTAKRDRDTAIGGFEPPSSRLRREWTAQGIFLRSTQNLNSLNSYARCSFCQNSFLVSKLTRLSDHVRDCASIGDSIKSAYIADLQMVCFLWLFSFPSTRFIGFKM
jgi:hypothetical protein